MVFLLPYKQGMGLSLMILLFPKVVALINLTILDHNSVDLEKISHASNICIISFIICGLRIFVGSTYCKKERSIR